MRLDKFLKNSRMIKRRTIAKEACDNHQVFLNGKEAKAGSEVEVGDEIKIQFGGRIIRARVLLVLENPKKEDASRMVEYL